MIQKNVMLIKVLYLLLDNGLITIYNRKLDICIFFRIFCSLLSKLLIMQIKIVLFAWNEGFFNRTRIKGSFGRYANCKMSQNIHIPSFLYFKFNKTLYCNFYFFIFSTNTCFKIKKDV